MPFFLRKRETQNKREKSEKILGKIDEQNNPKTDKNSCVRR
jgi:hypothetical protein